MEASALDFVAQACMDLTDALAGAASETDKDALITNHIKKVSSVVTPIDDFKKGMHNHQQHTYGVFIKSVCILF